jgi:hypothetical protein
MINNKDVRRLDKSRRDTINIANEMIMVFNLPTPKGWHINKDLKLISPLQGFKINSFIIFKFYINNIPSGL